MRHLNVVGGYARFVRVNQFEAVSELQAAVHFQVVTAYHSCVITIIVGSEQNSGSLKARGCAEIKPGRTVFFPARNDVLGASRLVEIKVVGAFQISVTIGSRARCKSRLCLIYHPSRALLNVANRDVVCVRINSARNGLQASLSYAAQAVRTRCATAPVHPRVKWACACGKSCRRVEFHAATIAKRNGVLQLVRAIRRVGGKLVGGIASYVRLDIIRADHKRRSQVRVEMGDKQSTEIYINGGIEFTIYVHAQAAIETALKAIGTQSTVAQSTFAGKRFPRQRLRIG